MICIKTNDYHISSSHTNSDSRAKLAVYTLWNCDGYPRSDVDPQFEFYDYRNLSNNAETGNDAPDGPNTSATFCPTTSTTATDKLFCELVSKLGSISSTGTQTGLIGSELNPTLTPTGLAAAQGTAKAAYLDYLQNGYTSQCAYPYQARCAT